MVQFGNFNFRLIAALLSGALIGIGFPGEAFPYFGAAWVMPFALVPLFIAIDTLPKSSPGHSVSILSGKKPVTAWRRFRSAFLLSWVCGTTTVAIGFYWATFPAILFGKIAPSIAYPGFGFYCVLSGLFFPAMLLPFLLQAGTEGRKISITLPLIPLALFATALEIWTPRFFFWSLGSLMHDSDSVRQWASVFGFSGITAAILISNAFISRAVIERAAHPMRSLSRLGGVAAMWLLLVVWGQYRIHQIDETIAESNRFTHVGVVQPNYTFDELSSNPTRSSSAQKQSLGYLLEISEFLMEKHQDDPLDLLIWPESVAPSQFASSEAQQEVTKDLVEKHNTPILVQATEFDKKEVEELGYYRATVFSTSFLLRPDRSRSPSYKKWIPIPFGESVPFEQHFPWLGDWVRDNIGNTSKVGRGTSFEALPYSPTDFVAPLICFDAIQPELPRLQVAEGNASLFVNQSNFVWMGRSNAGHEFNELVRFRAVENARSAVVAANTGPSVVYDPAGRKLVETTDILKPASFAVKAPVFTERTLYNIWGQNPVHAGGILAIFLILFSLTRTVKKKGMQGWN